MGRVEVIASVVLLIVAAAVVGLTIHALGGCR
jgi:hypothetical protein